MRADLLSAVDAFGLDPFRQREDCPDSPLGPGCRAAMIYYDMYTRFGYGGARPQAEKLARQLHEAADFEWPAEASEIVEEVKRAFPVFLCQ